MGLKSFHIFFLIVSVIFGFGFGWWGVREYLISENTGNLILGLCAFGGSLVLTIYGTWFLKKLKNVGYM